MLLFAGSSNAVSGEFVKLKLVRNAVVEAYVHLDAEAFDANKVLLALPPGAQNRGSVSLGLAPWIDELEATGWTVISPVAPSGRRFMGRNLGLVPHVLRAVKREYDVQFEKVSLFGISNGGIGALELAVHFTELFRSVTVAPGMLIVKDGIASLGSLPLTLVVGQNDALWLSEAKKLDQLLTARDQPARHELVVIPNAGHAAFESLTLEFLVKRLLRE
ncbi:MAG: hypothetical protein AB8C46_03810 [Burkholderiaceae bacterium]